MEKNKIEKAFSIFNGGEGLDHWSYSSTSTPFAKNIIGYSFPQEVRRKFPFRYKANFGNLVNNVVQKQIADVIYKTKTIKETEWDKDFNVCFKAEQEAINKNRIKIFPFGISNINSKMQMRSMVKHGYTQTGGSSVTNDKISENNKYKNIIYFITKLSIN